MRQIVAIGLASALLAVGCSDKQQPRADGAVPDVTRPPGGYGEACVKDADCSGKLCVDKVCSKICRKLGDCPSVGGRAFECGEVEALKKIACYPRRYIAADFGLGYDCSFDEKCAVGFTCLGLKSTTGRYCTNKCTADWDCPPRFRCVATRTGKDEVEAEKHCRRREFCHPCAIDDQCGEGNLCLADANNNRYCGKACAVGSTGSCPPYAKCEDAGNGKQQCKHKSGSCYKSFSYEGELCSPCIHHGWAPTATSDFTIAEDGVCKKEGFCYIFSQYVMEAGCIMPCGANDTCPTGGLLTYGCADIKSLGGKYCVPTVVDPETGQKIFGSCVP